jgi:hypothetical protein
MDEIGLKVDAFTYERPIDDAQKQSSFNWSSFVEVHGTKEQIGIQVTVNEADLSKRQLTRLGSKDAWMILLRSRDRQ